MSSRTTTDWVRLSSQTQAISKSCLQTSDDNSFPSKKADFALAFSPFHPDIEQKYKAMENQSGERPALSQMNDIYSASLALYFGAEVKKFSGDEVEAQDNVSNGSELALRSYAL